MLPRWPLVYVVGTVANLPVPRPEMQVVSVSVEQAGSVELALGGGQRHSEYGFWAVRPHGRLVTVLLDGDPVAVGATGGTGANQGLSHLRVATPELTTEAALCLIQDLTGEVGMAVPGPNPLLTTLLTHGWRVVDVDYAMASAPALIDPLVVLPHPGLC
jgi:hypothetical protein